MEKLTRREFVENIKNALGCVAQVGAVFGKSLDDILKAIERIDNNIKYDDNGNLLGARALKSVNNAMDKIVWNNDSELRLNNTILYRYYSNIHYYLIARDKNENGCTCVYVCHKKNTR